METPVVTDVHIVHTTWSDRRKNDFKHLLDASLQSLPLDNWHGFVRRDRTNHSRDWGCVAWTHSQILNGSAPLHCLDDAAGETIWPFWQVALTMRDEPNIWVTLSYLSVSPHPCTPWGELPAEPIIKGSEAGHTILKGRSTGGFKRGGFLIWTCPSFFCPFWDFPDFSGIFPICWGMVRGFSLFVLFLCLGLLRAPMRNSPERVRDTIWTFPKKWETPGFGNPGLASLNIP